VKLKNSSVEIKGYHNTTRTLKLGNIQKIQAFFLDDT